MFGGNGADFLYSEIATEGGDVMWLGPNEADSPQSAFIIGTGDNPENFTVVMDFWL